MKVYCEFTQPYLEETCGSRDSSFCTCADGLEIKFQLAALETLQIFQKQHKNFCSDIPSLSLVDFFGFFESGSALIKVSRNFIYISLRKKAAKNSFNYQC
jgi:hypothetical protein